MATSLHSRLQKRVYDRARTVLAPLGLWPAYRRLVPAGAIASRLAATLPGDLRDYEIDHRHPLDSYDLRDEGQAAEAFAVGNHRWLSRGANRRKGSRR